MNRLAVALVIAGVGVWSESAAPQAGAEPAKQLLSAYQSLNELCRGGPGDGPSTDKACEAREKVSKSLKRIGYCFGKRGQSGAEAWWHQCGPASLH